MSFDSKTDKLIRKAGDAGEVFDIALVQKINKALGRKFTNPQILQKRYNVLTRGDFTGKLIQDHSPPKPGDKDVVMIPARIKHKSPEPQPDAFADTDRLFVHMHNLFAELVAVVKEMAATEKKRQEIETERLKVQREQLLIQQRMYEKATEKKP